MNIKKLLKTPMTRQEFLGLGVFVVASAFGLTGLLRELASHAATPHVSLEPEAGAVSASATAVTDTTASGGKAIKYGTAVAASSTPWLPFDMPTKASLVGTDEVGIHQMMNYTVSVDNTATEAGDYWSTHWVTNGLTKPLLGKAAFSNIGAECRDRPIFRPARPEATGVWQVKDTKDIIRWCQEAAIDFSAPHTPGADTTSFEWKQLTWWIQASTELGTGFKVAPWVDCSTAFTANPTASATTLADLYTNAATKSAMWTVNGRPATIFYGPTRAPDGTGSPSAFSAASLTNLTTIKNTMKAKGVVNPFWWPVWQSGSWSTLAPQYTTVFDAASRFGDRDMAVTAKTDVNNRGAAPFAATMGYMWMAPGSRGATVPRGDPAGSAATGYYWESGGFGQLLAATKAAVEVTNVKRLMWNTGNDFPEGSYMFPSEGSGRNWLDLLAYMNVWYKLKTPPVITRDAVYIAHRKQMLTGTTYTSGQTKLMANQGSTAGMNVVDALVFLTAPANLVTTVGGVTVTSALLPAGMNRVTVPSRVGSVSAKIVRAGVTVVSVVSRHTIVSSIAWQDLEYYVTGSLESVARPALYSA